MVVKIVKGDAEYDLLMENIHKCEVTGCWWWKGLKDENGYGIAILNGVMYGLASRFIWNAKNPSNQLSLRSYPFMNCMNMKCVNPAHMVEKKEDSTFFKKRYNPKG